MDCWASFWIGFSVGVSSVPLVLALVILVGVTVWRRVP